MDMDFTSWSHRVGYLWLGLHTIHKDLRGYAVEWHLLSRRIGGVFDRTYGHLLSRSAG